MKKLMQLVMGLAMAILAVSPVWADTPPFVVPDQTYITFMPVPNEQPLTIVKDGTTDVKLYPKDKTDTVYYRILSVPNPDFNTPISENDERIEIKLFSGSVSSYEPIHVNESMINGNGQFIVRAAVKHQDGTFESSTDAAFNMEVLDPAFVTKLKFDAPEAFVVGAQYEMWINVETTDEVKAEYGEQMWSFIVNWDGVIFSNVEYRFSEDAAYTAVDPEDLDDVITISRKFASLVDEGIQFRFSIVRKRQMGMNTAAVSFGIGRGGFNAAEYLAAAEMNVPFKDRPAADPMFTPTAGYIEKGNAVTITCATPETDIYYTTDGSNPTFESALYSTPVTITTATTIKALAKLKNGQDSDTSFVAEAAYSVVGIPQIKPASGRVVIDTLVEITLGDGRGATLPQKETTHIYYTLDGSEPTAGSTEYTAPFRLGANDAELNVVAIDGDDQSPVITRKYVLLPAMPEASYSSEVQINKNKTIEIEKNTEITLTCKTPGTKIYWAWSVDIPNQEVTKSNGKEYTGPIKITSSQTLKAAAYLGDTKSAGASFTYTVLMVAPSFNIPGSSVPLAEGLVPYGARVELSSESVEDTKDNKVADYRARIAYTLDGTEPNNKAIVGNLPQAASPVIEITDDVTIKAVTCAQSFNGWQFSPVSTRTYNVVAPPAFEPEAGEVWKGTAVTLACATEGATIYYTLDGNEPSFASTEYTNGIVINKATTIKAIAYKGNDYMSKVVEAAYTIRKPVTPVFEPAAGEVWKGTEVTLSCADGEDVTIYYTIDGSEPTAESLEYTEAIVIDKAMTIKAVAFKGEMSEVSEAAYTVKKPAKPVFTPEPTAGEVAKGTPVTIASESFEATIYYTLDGSEPTAESTEYTEAIIINEDVTIKAVAILGEMSDVAEATYKVKEDPTTANEDLELAGVSVYPNPSDGELYITLPVAATVEVFAANGVLFQTVNASAGEIILNLHRSGIYFIRITGEDRTVVKRVIVR